ncbi:hypothetical protein VTN00DRAFT_7085 [Thermoascus crustaceus]|uniref:uncharacterized protein n=1 Tax=Thermoascus crustaceus TaxID=5088 RepID=UPI00374245BA
MDPLQRYFTYKWLLEVDNKSVGHCVDQFHPDYLTSLDPADRRIANQEQLTELSQAHIEYRHVSSRKRQRDLSEIIKYG